MAVLLPPFCPHCGPPDAWRCGLVFHPRWIHYKEVGRGSRDWNTMLATIVERTYRAPDVKQAPAKRSAQHIVIEVA